MTDSPVLDLAGVALEVHHLRRAHRFYTQVLGLGSEGIDDARGVAELRLNPWQTLSLWRPVTRQPSDPRLAPLHARGASHLHFAFQVLMDDLDRCRELLEIHDLKWSEVEMAAEGEPPDPALYFFDPFGHGLELRGVDPADARQPHFPPRAQDRPTAEYALPVLGLREVALGFFDYAAMKERLPRAYGFAFAKEQPERDFAQFTLAPQPAGDGQGTPQRWLYAWDPQVGLSDMQGGDHATARFYADVERVAALVEAAGLPHLRDERGLAVRDPDGHVFEFLPLP